MHKTSIIIAAAVATLGSAIGMAHAAPTRFVKNGITYEYTSETHGTRQVIEGRSLPSGEAFHLVVANGRVRGTSAGQPVSFDLTEVKSDSLQIASR